MQPDWTLIEEVVRRVTEAAKPLRIILFGSAARGSMGPGSDLDLLVVVPDGTPRRKTAQTIHRRFIGLGVAVDLVVATPEDLARHGRTPGLVYRAALSEGREIYAA